MVQFECPRAIHPLVPFTFRIHYGSMGCPFPCLQEKGNAGNAICGLLKCKFFGKNMFCEL